MKTTLKLFLAGTLLILLVPSVRAVDGSWIVDASGNWSDATNWSSDPAIPGGAEATINLTQDITANRVVTINTDPSTAGILNISDGTGPASHLLSLAASGGGYLLMDNGGSEARINMGGPSSYLPNGSTVISAPIRMTTGGLLVTAYSGNNLNITGGISADSAGTKVLRVATGAGNTTFSGVISNGAGTVAFLNDATTRTALSGANTFSGGVTVQQGEVRANSDAGYGTGTITLGTSATGTKTITLNNTGIRTYSNNIVVSSSAATATAKIISRDASGTRITYTGAIDLQRTLGIENNSADTKTILSGAISGAGGLTTLASSTSGVTILSGSNSYAGTTKVSTGGLYINGDSSAVTNAFDITGGGSWLGGTGTIGGSVTVSNQTVANAYMAPGDETTTGILTVANNVTLKNNGGFSARINGATAGTDYDRLVITESTSMFSLDGSNDLKLTLGYTPAANALFFLVDNQGSSAISGVFEKLNDVATDLSQGALFSVSGTDFYISYTGDLGSNSFTGGNDLVIQAIPEPSTWMLLTGALVAGLFTWRRRSA